ncbi:MAG: Glu-tRNA(Gln) amidotransferase subunit GatD [Nanoarchaeota archaeon]|jgi:glutamyl-tRNA(Gln) amidotransferase subunit D|nr:Glu-tRNA(Gln) amidotransferase subunit GatD [Nanoarchaeota archaeon]
MKCNAEFGDRVEVHKIKEIYEGVYLPSPEAGTFLLKLDNGYNIGFNRKDVNEIKLIKKRKEVETHFEIVSDGSKPTIGLVMIGGTISAKLNPGKGGVDWVDTPEELFKIYPNLFNKVNVKVESPFMKGSENMDFKDWQKVAKVIGKMLNDKSISGVILTQGTDTLHYTSAALSFFLRDLNKPVIVTYSQRSIDRASSDASLNLECSVQAAISNVAEVMTVGHANSNDNFCYAILGTKVKKLHSSRRDAFRPVNSEPILKISPEKLEYLSNFNPRENKKKVILDVSFEEKIGVIKFIPGQNPSILDYYLENGYKGIIIEFMGIGDIAVSGARLPWTKKLKEVMDKGMIVCATPQTMNGRLQPLVYVTGRELANSGIIFLEDMLTETAFVKLSWVLGHEDWAKDKEVVKEKMLFNFAKELNPRITE